MGLWDGREPITVSVGDYLSTKKAILGTEYLALTKLNDQLYLGAELEARDTELLKAAGITTVINLTCDESAVDKAAFNCFRLNQNDREEIPPATLKRFISWMDHLIDNGDVVLVHCLMGISRTPSFVIAWLMHRAGAGPETDLKRLWSKYEDQIGALRPIIQPHHALKTSVLRYFGYQNVSAFGPVE